MKATKIQKFRKQLGMTLIEIVTSLAIIGLVIGGALTLYQGASSSQQSNALTTGINSIRGAVKTLFNGQGGYGTAVLNNTIYSANRIPADWSVSTAASPYTITHPLNGTVTITGATSQFTVALTAIPTDVCTSLMLSAGSWATVKVGASAARTTPVTPATASTDCAVAATQTMTFTSN